MNDDSGTALINILDDKKYNCTVRYYKGTEQAITIHNTLGWPLLEALPKIVDGNMIKNCSINRKYIMVAKAFLVQILGY